MIRDRQVRPGLTHFYPHLYGSSLRRIFDRIIQEIEDRFLRPFRVMPDRKRLRTVHGDLDSLPVCRRAHAQQRICQCHRKIGLLGKDPDRAAFQPAHLNDGLDQKIHLICLVQRPSQKFLLLIRRHFSGGKQLQIHFYIRDRGLDLVGKICDHSLHHAFFLIRTGFGDPQGFVEPRQL